MKNIKNYLSIVFLMLILAGLIIAFNSVKKSTSLNTTDTKNDTVNTPQNLFDYKPARRSENKNINFENNFGGSDDEEIFDVFKLNYYYIIGTTFSNDKYFQEGKNKSVFIMTLDNYGNAIKVFIYEINNSIKIEDCKIYRNSFYILLNGNMTKLISFDMSTQRFDDVYTSNDTNTTLIVSYEPIIVTRNNTQSILYYVESKKSIVTDLDIESVVMATEYLNGTIIIYNSTLDAKIVVVENNNVTTLNSLDGKIDTFNITENGFIFLINSKDRYSLCMFDNNFDKKYETYIDYGTNFNLTYTSNLNIITYQNNGTLYQSIYCNHLSKICTNIIERNVTNYAIDSSQNIKMITKIDNTINIYVLNTLGAIQNNISLNISQDAKFAYFENINNSFTIIGTFTYSNDTITDCFGKKDIFVLNAQI